MTRRFKRPSHTQLPNEILDELMAELSGSEFKVLCYIARRTFGFHRDEETISLNQIAGGLKTKDGRVLDRGTGLTQKSVVTAVQSLEEKDLIFVDRTPKEGGFVSNSYRILLEDEDFLESDPSVKITEGGSVKNTEGVLKKLQKGSGRYKEEKESRKKDNHPQPPTDADVFALSSAIERFGVVAGASIATEILQAAFSADASLTVSDLIGILPLVKGRTQITSAGFFLSALPAALTSPSVSEYLSLRRRPMQVELSAACLSCGGHGMVDAPGFVESVQQARELSASGARPCGQCEWGKFLQECLGLSA